MRIGVTMLTPIRILIPTYFGVNVSLDKFVCMLSDATDSWFSE